MIRNLLMTVLLTIFCLFAAQVQAIEEKLLLKKGDILAICGDSITYSKLYSLVINQYLTACYPELDISCVQNAVYGERTGGFIKRLESSCLNLYHPNVVTFCYGMNDGGYQNYSDKLLNTYEKNVRKIVKLLKAKNVRPIIASPGIVGRIALNKAPKYNKQLGCLGDAAKKIARQEHCSFVDVHGKMLEALKKMTQRYGDDFDFCRKDGIHPAQPGQIAMAYAFLETFGFKGKLAQIEFNVASKKAKASFGHKVIETGDNYLVLESSRYPYCFFPYDHIPNLLNMRRVAKELGFYENLNNFQFKASGIEDGKYRLSWQFWHPKRNRWENGKSKPLFFDAEKLRKGINLARNFLFNPFCKYTYPISKAIQLKFILQYAIQTKALSKESNLKMIRDKLIKPMKINKTAEEIIEDPLEVNRLAELNLRNCIVPVKHRILIEKCK